MVSSVLRFGRWRTGVRRLQADNRSKLLLIAHQSNDSEIEEQVRRLVFLGTPFHGSDKAKWAATARKFMGILPMVGINKELLEDLEKDSWPLMEIGQSFPKYLRDRSEKPASKIEIFCFVEDRACKVGGLIVPYDSAKLESYECMTLAADHVGICKYSSREDENYKNVSATLQRWAEQLRAEAQKDSPRQVTQRP